MFNRSLFATLRRVASSLEINSIWLASFTPINAFRIATLRFWGASIGNGVAIHRGLQVRCARKLVIGDDCFVAEDVCLDARGGLVIERSVSVNTGAQIWTAQHDWRSKDFAYVSAPVHIGHHSWISARSVIIPGSSIGEGTVVAAGAVVTKDAPPWSLLGGNPAKVIGSRPVVDTYKLEASRSKLLWW